MSSYARERRGRARRRSAIPSVAAAAERAGNPPGHVPRGAERSDARPALDRAAARVPGGRGHFWVVHAVRAGAAAARMRGATVLDSFIWSDEPPDARRVREFLDRMARYGLEDRVIVAGNGGRPRATSELAERPGRRRPAPQLQLPPEPGGRLRGPAQRAGRHRSRAAPVLDQPRIHLSGGARPVLHDRRDGRERGRA